MIRIRILMDMLRLVFQLYTPSRQLKIFVLRSRLALEILIHKRNRFTSLLPVLSYWEVPKTMQSAMVCTNAEHTQHLLMTLILHREALSMQPPEPQPVEMLHFYRLRILLT